MVPTNVLFFPHSPKEFESASELVEWLKSTLSKTGEYQVATFSRGYRRVSAGSLVLFHKDRQIVGEAVAKDACLPYKGTDVSPVTGATYQGIIMFEPSSVRCYAKPVSLENASKLVGTKLIPQGVRQLEPTHCETLLSELRKCPVCGKEPCTRKFFLNKALDLYRNACEEGVVMCPQCGSEGNVRRTAPCPRCRDHGYPPPGAVCPVCKNRTYISWPIERCPLCKGAGEVSLSEAAAYRS